MTPTQWVSYALMIVIVVVGLRRLPQFWRDQTFGSQVPKNWPWGTPLWRGYIRCVPTMAVGLAVLVVAFPVLLLAPERSHGTFARPYVVVIPYLTLFAAVIGLTIATILFNRPRLLVAPHLRGQDGAATELWRTRRRRNRR